MGPVPYSLQHQHSPVDSQLDTGQETQGEDLQKKITIKSAVMRKIRYFGLSGQVRHKQACAIKEAGLELEISDLKRRGIF